MNFSSTDLLQGLEQNKLPFSIVFLGMSGSGKTHWSKRLAEKYGVKRYEFDSMIGKSIAFAQLLSGIEGQEETEKLAKYFGPPWSEGFQKREEIYLDIEKSLMDDHYEEGVLLDLTGSAIYHPEQLKKISENSLVVHLETPAQSREQMLQVYLSCPKPICWNKCFMKQDDETNEEALARCYKVLLESRETLYVESSNITIPYSAHRQAKTPEEFIRLLAQELS